MPKDNNSKQDNNNNNQESDDFTAISATPNRLKPSKSFNDDGSEDDGSKVEDETLKSAANAAGREKFKFGKKGGANSRSIAEAIQDLLENMVLLFGDAVDYFKQNFFGSAQQKKGAGNITPEQTEHTAHTVEPMNVGAVMPSKVKDVAAQKYKTSVEVDAAVKSGSNSELPPNKLPSKATLSFRGEPKSLSANTNTTDKTDIHTTDRANIDTTGKAKPGSRQP